MPEHDAGQQAEAEGEERDPRRQPGVDVDGDGEGRQEGHQQGAAPAGGDKADEAAEHGQQHALDQQLANQPEAVGAQRVPQRQLARPSRGAGEQQAGHVGADEEQQQPDDAAEDGEGRHQHALAAVRRAPHVEGSEAAAGVRVRVAASQACRHDVELGLHLTQRVPGAHPCEALQPAVRSVGQAVALVEHRLHHDRHEDVEVQRHLGALEPRGGDANHGEGRAVEGQDSAQRIGAPTEPALPEGMADHHDRVGALGAIVARADQAPDCRPHAEQVEHVARVQLAPDAFGAVAGAQAHRRGAEDGEVAEGAAARRPHVRVVRVREAQAVAGGGGHGDRCQLALGRDVAERVQEQCVHPAEDHGVGGHAGAERQRGEPGEQRAPDEQADGMTKIGEQHVDTPDPTTKPGRMGPGAGAATQQRPTGGRRRQPGALEREPVVREVGLPLASTPATLVGRGETGGQPHHRQRRSQPDGRAGHDSNLRRTGRKTLYRLSAADSVRAPAAVTAK